MNDIRNFEEIISASTLLDEEMDALRGGIEVPKTQCGGGIIAYCNVGTGDIGSLK